jgi:penicillin-binding protein 2
MGDKEPKELKERLPLATGVVLFAFLLLTSRFWYLQVMEGSYLKKLSQNNRIRLINSPAPRGLILDRNGIRLAENRPGFDLSIVPEDVKDWKKLKETLARLVRINTETIESKPRKASVRPLFQPIKLKEDLTWEEMVMVESFKFELPGVLLEVGPKRDYPLKDITAHLIGYLGEINEKEIKTFNKELDRQPYRPGTTIGKSGVEVVLEEVLRGIDGGKQVEVDAHGRIIKTIKSIPPYPGNNIRLTIDLPTQLAAWAAMRDNTGAVVAIDPRNGKILAMVSAPSFDPNILTTGISKEDWKAIKENPLDVLTNRAIQGQYPPASTFKVITAAAALEEKVIRPSTKIHAGPYFWFGGRAYRDWKEEGHGKIGVHRAIVESADTFFYQVGLKVGIEKVARYARNFGLGRRTGIGLKDEKPGLVPTAEWKKKVYGTPWFKGETVSVSVGQGFVLTTPIQLLNAYAAIANGGKLYTPQLVGWVETPEGEIIKRFSPEENSHIMVSKQTLELLKGALKGVVDEKGGTARWLSRSGLKIAGKTGTAQVIKMKEGPKDIEEKPYRLRDHAWFVGFAPYDDPKIAVAVIVEHGGFGARAAAPVALELFRTYLSEDTEGNPAVTVAGVNHD